MTPFSPRIHKAFDLAAEAHDHQYRKDPDREIPALSHLAGVAYILAQHGWDEDTVVAGALHDIDEDVVQKKNKPEVEKRVRTEFGDHVYDLIKYVTHQKKDEHGNDIEWEIRTLRYADKLRLAPPEAKAISCADKIHNIECILLAIEREQDIMSKLKETPERQIKKFEQLHSALSQGWSHPMLGELAKAIETLKQKVKPTAEAAS